MQVTYYIVQTMNGYWGRGNTIEGAKSEAKRQGGKFKRYLVHEVRQPSDSPAPFIDCYGSLLHWGNPFDGSVQTTAFVYDKCTTEYTI